MLSNTADVGSFILFKCLAKPNFFFIFNIGSDYVLKMRLLDHVFDDQYIENVVVRIILPEHSQ